jgi:hypothetical protein
MTKQKEQQVPAVQQAAAGPVTMVEPKPAFEEDAGAGFAGTGRDDMAIPFLAILQSGSPQCKRSEGAYIEGAAEGMILNTVTGKVIDTHKTPFLVVPCAYHRAFVEWRLRENGGGFVREHKPDPALINDTIRDEKNRDILPNGNQINDTRTFYVLALDGDGMPSPAVLTMTSTQIKKAKQWMMQQNLLKLKSPTTGAVYTPPMFASKWAITTVPESNDKGSWMGWKFEHAGYLDGPSDPVYLAARDFHKSVAAGETRVDMSKAAVDPETGEVRGPDRQPGEDDDFEY